jgi:hypothetical protein
MLYSEAPSTTTSSGNPVWTLRRQVKKIISCPGFKSARILGLSVRYWLAPEWQSLAHLRSPPLSAPCREAFSYPRLDTSYGLITLYTPGQARNGG